MTLSMYQASVPVFVRALTHLAQILQKGAKHAADRKIPDEVMLQTRLIPDMLPLAKQVQIATDMVKNGVARLAGVDAPVFDDNEVRFDELQARLDRTIAYLNSFKAEQIDGSESRAIHLKTRLGDFHADGQYYLLNFVLPNLFFHSTTAYAILRSAGTELGKADFLGGF